MTMKVKKYSASEERTILTALVTHSKVLGRVVDQVGKDRNLFKNKWSNTIFQWCLEYYEKYRKAPRGVIQSIFTKHANNGLDEDASEIIETFLTTLSRNYAALAEEINEQYVIDTASHYFDKIRLERMAEGIQTAVERNDLTEAKEAYSQYEPVSFAGDDWTNPFTKAEVVNTIRHYEEDLSIIKWKGALNEFLSPHFERDGFISFVGPEKRGKSFWLQETVWHALRNRRRVLYYTLGDMSKEQVNFRLYRRACLRPLFASTIKWPTKINILKQKNDSGGRLFAQVVTEDREVKGLTPSAVKQALKKLTAQTATKQLRLKLRCAGASVISASHIENDVREFAQEGWVPDVIVLDYADLLAPEAHSTRMDYRHQVNESWKVLRRITLDYHLLMVTATQSASSAYDSWVIRKKDFSEDKRKNAHVTGMLGINQTSDEKRIGVYRLNWVFLRDGAWTDSQVVWTAGNLALACPCLRSCL